MSNSLLFIGLCALITLSQGDSPNIRGVFDKIADLRGSVYTPDEHSEHFSRFQGQLEEVLLQEEAPTEFLIELFNNTKPALLQSMVDEINSMQNSWTASKDQPPFKGMSIKDVPTGCPNGPKPSSTSDDETRLLGSTKPELTNLPSDFDARQKFASCAEVIGHVRDQGACHNCWATGSTGMFNDRVCIKSGGSFQNILSLGYFTSCCNPANGCPKAKGCEGGNLLEGLNFLKNHGIVTGNEFKPASQLVSADGCWPYPFPKCNHVSSAASRYPKCSAAPLPLPACKTKCTNKSYKTSLQQDLHRAKSFGRLPATPQKIKQEIFDNGPVLGMISMYEDFRLYKSGVYVHKTGSFQGIHSLRIIGWGIESGQDYWLTVNSWNEEWGDHGMIKLAVGTSGIENSVYYVEPV